jgi:hypothetical protein
MASTQVKILIVVAGLAALYAFRLDVKKQRQIRELVARIKDQKDNRWHTLPWLHRALIPRAGLAILFKTSAVGDVESLALYQKLRFVERKQMVTLIVAALAIVVLLIGTRYWGWHF